MNFLRRYEQLGEKFDPEEISLKKTLRISELIYPEKVVLERLNKRGVQLRKVPFLNKGYEYESKFSVASTEEYLLGLTYIQEAGSQLPVLALNPKPGDLVADMAAAPGSKTTQIVDAMKNEGRVIAVDTELHRLIALRNNLERMRCRIVASYKKDARFLKDLGLKFDKILLDAPCSGNFCIQPDYFEIKNKEGIKERVKLQRELLKSAVSCLKEGGTLVYSTCSLEPEENEMNVDWLLNKYNNLKLVPTGLKVGDPGITNPFDKALNPSIKLCTRIWPHKTSLQGFFIAKFRKA